MSSQTRHTASSDFCYQGGDWGVSRPGPPGCQEAELYWCAMGFILNSKLFFEKSYLPGHKVFFCFKKLNLLSLSNAETLVNPFMTSSLNYCNALLGDFTETSVNKLQAIYTYKKVFL